MLQCQDLTLCLNKKTILNQVNFNLEQGQHLLILGKSGAGKSTLLSLLSGLHVPTSGDVLYDNQSLFSMSEIERDIFRGYHIGMIFQNFHLIKSLTVLQNINIVNYCTSKNNNQIIVTDYVNKLSLTDKLNAKITSLSIGEQQRVAIIRSLINQPKWLLCDEPTSALDDDNTDAIIGLLKEEATKINTSLIIVTHDHRVKRFFVQDKILPLGN